MYISLIVFRLAITAAAVFVTLNTLRGMIPDNKLIPIVLFAGAFTYAIAWICSMIIMIARTLGVKI